MLLARLAPRTARGLLALVAAAAVVVSSPGMPSTTAAAEPDSPSEVRALWVLRTSLASPESIASLVRSARDHAFNTLLVQVRGRGDAYFNNGVEPRATRAPAPTGRLRSARNRPHVSARCGTSGARLDQRQPGVERGRSAYCARSPRQQAPRVADGAARDRAGRREGRGRQPCLRRQARPVDTRADRGARRPLRISDRSRRRRLPPDRRART